MSEFQRRLEQVVGDFLETALVVDDEAMRPRARRGASLRTAEPAKTKPHARIDLSLELPPEGSVEVVEDHPLDSKSLIDAFADNGIICSVIAPRANEEIQMRVINAASRADLLVLDWQLHRDSGKTALALITGVLERDAEADRRRLRVIAIYTGQPDLLSVMRRIATDLKLGRDSQHDGGLTLATDGFRIVGLCKPLQKGLRPEIAARQVKESDLPQRLASEFAKLTDGLVPAVALAALTALRSDTHRILQALSPQLDPSYLGTRAAQVEPSDSEETLIGLVTAEIRSVLDDHLVGEQADHRAIKRWITYQRERGVDLGDITVDGGVDLKIDDEGLLWILEKGLGDDERLKATVKRLDGITEKALKKIKRNATKLFTPTTKEAQRSDALLSQRMAVRTHYRHPQRALQLGTLVACDGEVLVCVQPLCDAVRLKKARAFPFLAIAKVTSAKGADFMFTAPGQADPLRLRIDVNPYGLLVHELAPTSKGVVVAAEADGSHTFTSEGSAPATLVWLGQLKPEFAQKVATDLAHAFGRIGLDEHELMRLSRTGE